jgi:hypothetical protein
MSYSIDYEQKARDHADHVEHVRLLYGLRGPMSDAEFEIYQEMHDKLSSRQLHHLHLETNRREKAGDFRHWGPGAEGAKWSAGNMPRVVAENKAHDALPWWCKKAPAIKQVLTILLCWICPPPGL